MLILGIDTSGKTASVAVYDSEKEVFLSEASIYTRLTHSQVIMPLCSDVLKRAEKNLGDIDIISVANGPGSYTGLRIGVSSVKAMSFGTGCKVCGISTLESMAYNNISFSGFICPVMKARENLVYTSVYLSNDSCLDEIMKESIISQEELAEYLLSLDSDVILCGDGSVEFYEKYKEKSDDFFKLAPPNLRLQNACGICLASVNKDSSDPEALEVSYLQKVKAEKDLENNK